MRSLECDPSVEIIGQNVLAFLQNIRAESIHPILEAHGLATINPDQWYPLQAWLNVLRDIQKHGDASLDYVAIGMALSTTAPLPPDIANMPLDVFFMNMLNAAYQMQHRNGNAGTLNVEKVAEGHIKITVAVPYPDDLEYGAAYGFARRFLPPNHSLTVKYDENTRRHDEGGDNTIIHIMWKER